MRRKGFFKVAAGLAAVVLLFATVPAMEASANSAQRWFHGVDSNGVVITGKDSPVVVEKERLVFDVTEFPEEYYAEEKEFLAYAGKVTAEYTFYNPSEYEITANLLFSFGMTPDYIPGEYNEDETSYRYADDTEKFDIMVNGTIVDKTLRHSLCFDGYEFLLEEELDKLTDGYWKTDFYSPELPVKKYVYEISGVDAEAYPAASAGVRFRNLNGETKIYMKEQSGMSMSGEEVRCSLFAENGKQIQLYCIGKLPAKEMEWEFCENGAPEGGKKIGGTAKLISEEAMTFEEFCMLDYPTDSDILATDWYNAKVLAFQFFDGGSDVLSEFDEGAGVQRNLMRWYEYEITLGPGERVVNTVAAPMYPDIDSGWEPAIYDYTYLWSPAKTWAEFGTLEVVVNTPYVMTKSVVGNWEKTENGYRKMFDGLPSGELTFTLCAEEQPEEIQYGGVKSKLPYVRMLASFLWKPLVLIVGVGGTVYLVRKKKGKK